MRQPDTTNNIEMRAIYAITTTTKRKEKYKKKKKRQNVTQLEVIWK